MSFGISDITSTIDTSPNITPSTYTYKQKTTLSTLPEVIIPIRDTVINMDTCTPGNSEINFIDTDVFSSKLTLPIQDINDYNKFASDITSSYMGAMSYYSITLDLIAIYLKGQKIIYIESKTFCEQCLYCLMLPAILVSAICTVISTALKGIEWGSTLVSALAGTNSFILAVVTYLKLDAKSEAHRTASYQFDKLQTMCEFYSGRCLLLSDDNIKDKIEEFVIGVEKKVGEIKDVNQFSIPESIRYRYSNIYGTNVFSIVKSYKTNRVLNTQRLLTIYRILEKNEFNINDNSSSSSELDFKIKNNNSTNPFTLKEELEQQEFLNLNIYKASKLTLLKEKDRLIKEIIEYRKISLEINDGFNTEIQHYIDNQNKKWFNFSSFLKT